MSMSKRSLPDYPDYDEPCEPQIYEQSNLEKALKATGARFGKSLADVVAGYQTLTRAELAGLSRLTDDVIAMDEMESGCDATEPDRDTNATALCELPAGHDGRHRDGSISWYAEDDVIGWRG